MAEERDPIGQLYDVADDHEAATLDDLRKRAGLIWECPKCSWFNQPKDAECEQCDTPKPEGDPT